MTRDAWNRLVDQVACLRNDLVVMAGETIWEPGVVHVPTAQAARRLETLRKVLECAVTVEDTECVAIGRRATLLEADGVKASYALVFPGDADPLRGRVSAESPLGSAILGARAGEVVEVAAPSGRRKVTVLSVE